MTNHIIEELYNVLQERKNAPEEKSYVSSLYAGNSPIIAKKILEEAQELIDESLALDKNPDDPLLQKNIRAEAADLLFHVMVMLSHHNVPPNEVFKILEERFGTSGHVEKANRSKSSE